MQDVHDNQFIENHCVKQLVTVSANFKMEETFNDARVAQTIGGAAGLPRSVFVDRQRPIAFHSNLFINNYIRVSKILELC
jgi:hypothetical protein